MGSDIWLGLEMRLGFTGDLVVFREFVVLDILLDCSFGCVGLDI